MSDKYPRLAFIDSETTGLDPNKHEPWEVGLILRDERDEIGDTEYRWLLPVDVDIADPKSLEISKFNDRHPWGRRASWDEGDTCFVTVLEFATQFFALTRGAVWIGANPTFDVRFLQPLIERHAAPEWHYRPICIESLTVGYVEGLRALISEARSLPDIEVPWRSSAWLSTLFKVDQDESTQHTALGDARMVRDLWDCVMLGGVR